MRKLFSTHTSDSSLTAGTLLLRITGAALMIPHGFDKLTHFSTYASKFMDPFGTGKTTALALVIFAEFFCACFVLMGLFTRLACIPLIIAMAVALFKAHGGQVFGDGQAAAIFLGLFLSILFLGPGKASLDRFLAR